MDSIEPPSWGPPVAYLYTLKLDDLSLAWEYLRRNPQYRSEFDCTIRHHKLNLLPTSWGLLQWEDPREDARSVEPAWLSVANTEIVLIQGDAGKKAPSFDPWKIPGRKTLHHHGEYVRLTARRGSEVLYRVRWPEKLNRSDPVSVSVAGGLGFTVRARAAQRFLRLLEQGPHGAFTEPVERPSMSALTHMHVLQALDGEVAGASHREIARRLFALSSGFSWDSDSRWRARVRYLIRCGRARTAHGYRRMAGLHGQGSDSDVRRRSPERIRLRALSGVASAAGAPA
jgi:hypothetical protein